jgi:hypothetical protein
LANFLLALFVSWPYVNNLLLSNLTSVLKMETVCSSETLVSTYKFIRCYISEDQHRHLHRRRNLRSHRTNVWLYLEAAQT